MSTGNNIEVFDCPVCLIIFRRPDCTRRLLDKLAEIRPRRLFVVADGPRQDHPDDIEACAETRRMIDRIDWPCEVVRNYSDTNMGCGIRPSSGINWLFEQVDEAIILEDDCIPEPSFFRFCAELLARYRDDHRVMHISGCTYRREDAPTDKSYYFSRAPGCWGWATWRRAWKHYDNTVRSWPEFRHGPLLMDFLRNESKVNEYTAALEEAYSRNGACSFWDYQWGFTCFVNSGLSVYPRCNLISNVGFGSNATHTLDPHSHVASIPTKPLQFPLTHPPIVGVDKAVERYFENIDFIASVKCKLRCSLPFSLMRGLAKRITPPGLRSMLRRALQQ